MFSHDLDNASRHLCKCVTAFRPKVLVLSQGLCLLAAGSRNLMEAKNKSTQMSEKWSKGRSGLNPLLRANVFIWFGKVNYFTV